MFSNSPQNFNGGPSTGRVLPVSRISIVGLVSSVVGFAIFGFLGLVGVILGVRGILEIRAGKAKGMWIAVLAIVLGVICSAAYVANLFLSAR